MKSTAAEGPAGAIARCVSACASARDGRGRWRAERDCAAALLDAGTSPTVARMSASSASSLGAWIAKRAVQLAVPLGGGSMT